MDVIADAFFDIANSVESMGLRLFKPEFNKDFQAWECRIEIDAPLNISKAIYGESSLQALILATKAAASYLYGSDLYKKGQLGIFGDFGGDLSIPAPSAFLKIAPYPF